MDYVTPIDDHQQREVAEATDHFIALGETLFARQFPRLPVLFDLRGRASGMYRVRGGEQVIRYNPWLFAVYYDDCLGSTVPHEVAHYLTDMVYGLRRIRPHGREWKAVMSAFGADARVTSDYSLEGIPVRRTAKYPYACGCDTHWVGPRRHGRIARQRAIYRCRRCGETLKAVP